MALLPYVKRAELKGKNLETYDEAVKSHNTRPGYQQRTEFGGIYALFANDPELAKRISAIADYNLNEGGFDLTVKELVVLTVARQLNCQLEWTMHEAGASPRHLRRECIEAIKHRQWDKLLPEEALWVNFTRGVMANKMPEDAFNAVLKRIGPKRVMGVTTLAVFTAMICYYMDAFKADMNPDTKPLLPIP